MTKPAKPNKSAGQSAAQPGNNPTPQEIEALVSLFNQGRYTEVATLAQVMTIRFPRHGFGWKVLGAVFKQMGRNADALAPMQKSAALSPNDADAHNNLGVTLHELGRLDEAEASLVRALQINPNNAVAHNNLGKVLHDLRQLSKAEASYRWALQLNPDYAQAHCNLGTTLYCMRRLDEAETSLRRALQISPNFAKAHSSLGIVLQELGKLGEAEACYRQALQINPGYAEVHSDLGILLHELDRLDEAEASYRHALQIKPDFTVAHNNLGNTLQELGRLDEAEASFRQALQIKPDYAEAHCNLSVVLHKQGRLEEAEACCRQALQANPDYAEAHSDLGIVLHELGRLEEAEASYQRALQINPNYAEVYNNRGNNFQNMGRLDEAETSYRHALQIKPDYVDAQLNLSMVFLVLGQFQRGWQGYEARWKLKEARRFAETPYPCWLGEEDIAGKKLLIQFEQGLGDAIQMLRYVPLLEQKNIECWIQVPASLRGLIARSFPRSKVIEQHSCPEGLDYRIPVMSLPLAMQTFSEQSIPGNVPYLIPDDERVAYWRAQLTSPRSRAVGLVWRGNTAHKNDRNRSASLTDLLPLIAAHPLIQFVTLQKDMTGAERNALMECNNTRILDGELSDFDETAAVMCNMDTVISVDTAPAHLSGALGRPTWILLWFGGEWRWMTERTDSPWYPAAKLFRQKSIGNWAEVISNVEASFVESGVQTAEKYNAEHQHASKEKSLPDPSATL